ncbi:hypothetical protein K501DRAFT_334059, partial [Backusella circina FSU 941]
MADEEYEVEKLLDHQPCERFPGTIEYLIKWRGFDNGENSWEREVNVFAKHLIDAYWKPQKISRNDYLKSIKPKKKSSDTSSSKTAIKKTTKKQEHKKCDLETIELSVKPANGLKWSDLKKILNVYHSERAGLFSEAKWSDNTVTLTPNYIIREYQPSVVIQYYE